MKKIKTLYGHHLDLNNPNTITDTVMVNVINLRDIDPVLCERLFTDCVCWKIDTIEKAATLIAKYVNDLGITQIVNIPGTPTFHNILRSKLSIPIYYFVLSSDKKQVISRIRANGYIETKK